MVGVTTLPRNRSLTRADLDAMPDDGYRHELIDGALIVTPAPARRHQRAVVTLVVSLEQICPADLSVLVAPFDVVLAENTIVQPDVLVARRADLTERDLPAPPVLVVEVLSPSTRGIDLLLKRARYETAGCRSNWVIDPGVPSLTAWRLEGGRYVEEASVVGDETFTATLPFPVTIRPTDLVDA